MFLNIDLTKCNRDGLCIDECPARIIEMSDDGPVAIEMAEKICIRCGHCVAVCPEAALALDFLGPEDCLTIDTKLQPDAEQVVQFLRSRRSVRTYRKKEVPRDLIEKVISLASIAPTGSNRQQVQWLIVHKKEDVRTVTNLVIDWMQDMVKNQPEVATSFNMEFLIAAWNDGADRICRDAPHLIFTYTANDIGSGKADCDTALAYLELALPSFGLGSCWAGYVTFAISQWPPLRQYLKIKENEQVHGGVMLGHPKYRYQRIPLRNQASITYI